MLGLLGFDYFTLEGQHGAYDDSLYLSLIRAAEIHDMTPVARVKQVPQGERGFGRFSRANFYGMLEEREAVEAANAESLVVAQIEDRAGIEHIEEIVQVSGIDILSVGPSDLSQSYGLPGQYDHPTVKAALERFHDIAFKSGLYVNSAHPEATYRLTSWAARIQELQTKMPGRVRFT